MASSVESAGGAGNPAGSAAAGRDSTSQLVDEGAVRAFIRSHSQKLAFRDDESQLRQNLRYLREVLRNKFGQVTPSELDRSLLLALIEYSLEISNLRLSLLVVAKLKLVQLALLIGSTLKPGDKRSELVAAIFVANHFGLTSYQESFLLQLEESFAETSWPSTSLEVFESDSRQEYVDILLNLGQLGRAQDFVEMVSRDSEQAALASLHQRQAQYYEADGAYLSALREFEACNALKDNSIRLIIKQCPAEASPLDLSSHMQQLQRQQQQQQQQQQQHHHHQHHRHPGRQRQAPASVATDLALAWAEFNFIMGNFRDSGEIARSNGDLASYVRSSFMGNFVVEAEELLFGELPARLHELIGKTTNPDLWLDKRHIDRLELIGSSLPRATRAGLAEVARLSRGTHQFVAKSCNLYLSLGEIDMFLELLSHNRRRLGRARARPAGEHGRARPAADWTRLDELRCVGLLSSHGELAEGLCQYLAHEALKPTRLGAGQALQQDRALFISLFRLGLLNEALQLLASERDALSETELWPALDHLSAVARLPAAERAAAARHRLDPFVARSSVGDIGEALATATSHEATSLGPLMAALLVHALGLLVARLADRRAEPADGAGSWLLEARLAQVEAMFQGLLEGHCFERLLDGAGAGALASAADDDSRDVAQALVGAAEALVGAVKDKLDVLADSDTVRLGVRRLIETCADRCLRAGHYQRAGQLYELIEDKVNAVRALMRLGSADVVINFSMSARDIAVNRLTMNYLKHLGASAAVIEDFVSKSKQQQLP